MINSNYRYSYHYNYNYNYSYNYNYHSRYYYFPLLFNLPILYITSDIVYTPLEYKFSKSIYT